MAVAEMSKLNLAAMSYDRDALLNALQKTGAVEIKLHYEAEHTEAMTADSEGLRAYADEAESALARLCSVTDTYNKEHKIKSDILKDGFDVPYSEFISAGQKKAEMDELVAKINQLYEEEKQLQTERNKVLRTLSSAQIYSSVKFPLKVEDSAHVKYRLGTLPADAATAMQLNELCSLNVLAQVGNDSLIFAAYHKSVAEEVENALQESGFNACPFDDGRTGEEIYTSLTQREMEIVDCLKQNTEQTYALSESLRDLKIYCDYLGFELEKSEISDKLRATQTTFLLEAYVPKEAEEGVKQAIEQATDTAYFEFSKPSDDETPPTLLKNNKVIKNFETITDSYSPVNYKEFDPNTVMAFFYSLFLGFIMADIGYGILMVVFGSAVYFKIKHRSTMKSLAGVFAVGGVFTLIWGFLFNSLFGIQLPFNTVLPDAQRDMWLFMGIKLPAVLVISLLIGVVQLCVGYVCKAVQCWRRGQIWDGILDGMVWALFTLGAGLAIVGLVEKFNVSVLVYVGGIMAASMLVIAIFTAGRKEKLLGKFTKGFGAAYGVINFVSDIFSYSRLYGLMLSGAVIAQIVSQYSIDFITGGNPFLIILGIVLMVVGHVFNLAIGLLGAYIHDARLQYVEFYGRFYEGEGELFAPLGSKHKYIYLTAEKF